MQPNYRKFFDPVFISKLQNLELKAKFVVEGFISGLHKSPFHGLSVEFAEHRQYMPGDDLKYLDWKVLGRTDRYFIKQFEEETNLKSYLVLDTSRSMLFNSGESTFSEGFTNKFAAKSKTFRKSKTRYISKLEYATYLAASLSLLMFFQKDASGLVTYDEKINTYISPRSTSQNLKLILNNLSLLTASGKTNTALCLNTVAEKIKRRGLVIVFSDLLDDPALVINSLRHFRYKKNEVIVFHILDPLELSFTINSPTIFKDMETEKELLTQPVSMQQAYKEAVSEFLFKYKKACLTNNIDYVLLSTSTSFDTALLEYLNKRKRLL